MDRFTEPPIRKVRVPSEDEMADYKEQEVERMIDKERARQENNKLNDERKNGPW